MPLSPLELLVFVPVAVLTNTALPVSFDPILVAFAAGRGPAEGLVLSIVGTACAACGAFVDLRIATAVRRLKLPAWTSHFPAPEGAAFYVWTALLALSPLPFALVRAALLRVRPSAPLYALAVAAGRFPRYLLLVFVWQSFALPSWAGIALPAAFMLLAAARVRAARGSAGPGDDRSVIRTAAS